MFSPSHACARPPHLTPAWHLERLAGSEPQQLECLPNAPESQPQDHSTFISPLPFRLSLESTLSSLLPRTNACFNSVFFFYSCKTQEIPSFEGTKYNHNWLTWLFFNGIAIISHMSPFISLTVACILKRHIMNTELLTLEACWWELHYFYKKDNDILPKAEHFLFLIYDSKFNLSEMQQKCQQCQKGVGQAMETAALWCKSQKRYFLSRNWACGSCKR